MDAIQAYKYAANVVKGRWLEGEPIIAKDAYISIFYAKNVIGGRFLEGEKAIAKNGQYAYFYAENVIKGRWPEGEEAILNSSCAEEYKNLYMFKPFVEFSSFLKKRAN